MLYFVKPFGGLEWAVPFGQELIETARDEGADLGLVRDWWQEAERPASTDDVRAALRYGIEASGGIVVAAIHVITIHDPIKFRALIAEPEAQFAAYRAHPQVKAVDEWIEQSSPGWIENGREIDKGVAESMRETLAEREAEAEEELSAPLKPELVSHWKSIGGVLPDPL